MNQQSAIHVASPRNVVVGLSGLSTAGARRGEMEGRYWICTMHTHRHDPVRSTSSRDPCLDHPASQGKTVTTQPAMVTPPAVPTAEISYYRVHIPGQSRLDAILARETMDGPGKRLPLVPRKPRDWVCWAMVPRPRRRPLPCLKETLPRAVLRDDGRNGSDLSRPQSRQSR